VVLLQEIKKMYQIFKCPTGKMYL